MRKWLGRSLALSLLAALASACASGGGSAAPGSGSSGALPEVRGFDGGAVVQGGFTNAASATVDSVVPEPRGRVWGVLPDAFETLGVETGTVDPTTFTMGDPGSRISRIEGSTRLSQYLDCGIGILGPNADRYEVTMQLLVRLAHHSSGGTVVRTTLDAYARPRDSAGDPIHCASQRTLERRIMALIDEELRGGAPAEAAPGLTLPATMSPGRIPRTGDVLRVQCRSPLVPTAQVGQGRLVGAGNGAVQIEVDARGRTVAIPAANMLSVQIRERRSYAFLGGLVGALLGGAAGTYYGATEWYDPNSRRLHYGKGTFTVIGGVAGIVGGFVVGRVAGSLIRSETWHAAPPEWAMRTSGAAQASAAADTEPSPCPSFDAG